MAKLTTKTRRRLPASAFAIPPDRYPIHDIAHARNALARVAANGTPEEKRKVARAVARRYGIGPAAKEGRKLDLANGKPPYQWKHGWIPLTPDAQLIKAKKKSGSAKDAPAKVKVEVKAKSEPPAAAPEPKRRSAPEPTATQQRMMELVEVRGDGDPSDTPEGFEVGLKLTEEWYGLVEAKGLTSDEQDAINQYQFGESDGGLMVYQALNRMKRGDRSGIDEDEGENLERIDEDLRSALAKSTLSKDAVAFRGLSDGRPPLKVGDVVTDQAWVSTSTNPEMAMGFARHGDKAKARVMVIPLPKGTHVIQPENEDEWELLVGPDVPMRVARIEGPYVYMELQ